jgi:hypothetical protein
MEIVAEAICLTQKMHNLSRLFWNNDKLVIIKRAMDISPKSDYVPDVVDHPLSY